MKDFDELIKEAGLNRSQKKFCKMPVDKNIKLLAPAGSGKTYSLLWRCRYITDEAAKNGYPKPNFLIFSFTKSAKLELESRIEKRSEFKKVRATIRTLNSWGWELIKRPGIELITTRKQKANLIIHDLQPTLNKFPYIQNAIKNPSKNQKAADVIELMDLLKSLGFTHHMSKTDYKSHVKEIKDLGLFPILAEGYEFLYKLEGIQGEEDKTKEERVMNFFEFWKKAVVYLDAVGRYTFEDQKYWARLFLEKQIEEKKTPSRGKGFTHIMVDEFQDINPLDMYLLKAACLYFGQKRKKTPITILGDDDQAIFGWRGSTPRYILHPDVYFETKFATCVLEINYRSPKNIVELSNQLLSYNRERETKEIRSGAKGRASIKVVRSRKVASSIDATMKIVKSLLKDKKYSSIALIGRRQTTLFPYQVLLGNEKIAYYVDYDMNIFEGEAMTSLQEIIHIVDMARNKHVRDPINSLIVIIDKIQRYELNKQEKNDLKEYLIDNGVRSFKESVESLKDYSGNIKKNLSGKKAYTIIRKLIDSDTVYDLMEQIVSEFEGFDKDYTKQETDVQYKEPQFFRLKEISKSYGKDFAKFNDDIDMARIMAEHSYKKSADDSMEAFKDIEKTRVHLMTATRSKGHEYDAVIILDADDEVWPDRLSGDIEAERRLFYVALSRARKNLYFVTSDDTLESRFLLETRLI